MKYTHEDTAPLFKKSAKIVSVISFLADVITVILFIRDILISREPINFSAMSARVTIIIAIFIFGIILLRYQEDESVDTLIQTFSWLYAVLAASVLGVASYKFIIVRKFSLLEFVGYLLLVGLISALSLVLADITEISTKDFSVPYMVVALEQIILWLYKILSSGIRFDVEFFGSLFYFLFSGIMIAIFVMGWNRFVERLS